MATPNVLEVFGECFDGQLSSSLQNAVLEKCKLDIASRSLDIVINTALYITHENQIKINTALKETLQLNDCNVKFVFTEFSEAACGDIADELKIKNPAVNGYLNFKINKGDFVRATLDKILSAGENYGASDEGNGKTSKMASTASA